jgi:hypothetical protein
MLNINICSADGCNNSNIAVNRYFDGSRYCPAHYQEIFSMELEALWRAWEKDDAPPERLRYLIGRWYSEFETAYEGKPFLTQGIVKDRSLNWLKTKDGARFTVIRKPVVKGTMGTVCRLVYDTWRFDLNRKTFRFLRQCKGGLVAL